MPTNCTSAGSDFGCACQPLTGSAEPQTFDTGRLPASATPGWLATTFGFRERMRLPGPDGKITHAEMELVEGVIMMGCPGPDYQNPRRLGHVTQHLYVYVDDVDEHFEHARGAGATILDEPEDQFYGDRRYGVEDREGHHRYFAQHVRDVAPEDMKPPA